MILSVEFSEFAAKIFYFKLMLKLVLNLRKTLQVLILEKFHNEGISGLIFTLL